MSAEEDAIEFIRMDDEEDFLMRPIKAGYLPFLALRDKQYDLADFVFCNEALDVEYENQYRARKRS